MAVQPLAWLGQRLLRSRYHSAYLRLTGQQDFAAQYRRFAAERVEKADPVIDSSLRVSVLMPVFNPNPRWVAEAIESVRAQTYPNWELCICDDGSATAWDPPADPRIRLARAPTRLGIAGALNKARTLASGDLLCFLDHDDKLSPLALQYLAAARAEFVYTDEEYISEDGAPLRPHWKPDWSPELLSNCMYVGHLMGVSARRFDQIGGFRSEYDGAQDYDLALRITEVCAGVKHVAQPLYRWREHARSIARNVDSKPYSHRAGRRALEDAVHRRGWTAEVLEDRIPNQYRLRRPAAARSEVQLFLPGDPLSPRRDFLLFMDSDLRAENADWLDWMTAQLLRPEVGVVGGRILGADGLDENSLEMVAEEMPADGLRHPVFWKWLSFPRNVKRVSTGCMGVRREVWERLRDQGSARLCEAARAADLEVILEANAVLRRVKIER